MIEQIYARAQLLAIASAWRDQDGPVDLWQAVVAFMAAALATAVVAAAGY